MVRSKGGLQRSPVAGPWQMRLGSLNTPSSCLQHAVSFEAELLAERVRSAALEARAAELGAKLAAHQRQEQLRLAR